MLALPLPQVVVTAGGVVALANRQAEMLFGVSPRDVGRPFRDLEISYRPVELRRPIELQSTNDELQTINDELQDRTGDLDRANGFLETILTSLRAGVVVVDPDLHVQVWNQQAQELWGLRPEEAVGQHFLNLDIGLPTDLLRPMIRQTLAEPTETEELVVAAVNRRGRTIDVRVLASPLRSVETTVGVIMTMEDVAPAAVG